MTKLEIPKPERSPNVEIRTNAVRIGSVRDLFATFRCLATAGTVRNRSTITGDDYG